MSERGPDALELKGALRAKYDVPGRFFATEVKNGPTATGRRDGDQPYRFDAVSIQCSYAHPHIDLFEIKVSRSDFMKDSKYHAYYKYCNSLWLVTPWGMVQKGEIPVGIGLIWYDPATKSLTVRMRPPLHDCRPDAEMLMYCLFSKVAEREGPAIGDERTPEALRALMSTVDPRATDLEFGKALGTRMAKRLSELAEENEELRSADGAESTVELSKVRQALEAKGLKANEGESLSEAVAKATLSGPPSALRSAREGLESALRAMDEYEGRGRKEAAR